MQKKDELAKKEEERLQQAIRNKEEKNMNRYNLEMRKSQQVAEQKVRIQSARRERAESKLRVNEELTRQRSETARSMKQMTQ